MPALFAGKLVDLLTLLCWPIAAPWRYRCKRQWSEDGRGRRDHLAVRLVLLIDAAVIVATVVFFIKSSDLTIFSDALDALRSRSMRWHGSVFSGRS